MANDLSDLIQLYLRQELEENKKLVLLTSNIFDNICPIILIFFCILYFLQDIESSVELYFFS